MSAKSGNDSKKAKPDKSKKESSAKRSSVASKHEPKPGHESRSSSRQQTRKAIGEQKTATPRAPTEKATRQHSQSQPSSSTTSAKQSASETKKLSPAASSKDSKNKTLDSVLSIPIHVEIGQPNQDELNAVSKGKEKSMTSNTSISPSDQSLLKSYMSGKASKDPKKDNEKKKGESDELEMDFLNTLNINAFGNFLRVWGDLYFGKTTKSAPCRMLFDTGSSITWINRDVYLMKCGIAGAKLGTRTGHHVRVRYALMENDIIGQLFKNAVSFETDDSLIESQEFVLIDESKYPLIKDWRMDHNIIGVIGLESSKLTKGDIIGCPQMKINGIVDNLLQKYSKPARIIGIDIHAPSESTLRYPPNSTRSMARGELHFGGFKRNVFAPNEPVWASMGKIAAHLSPGTFAMDMKIKCKDKIVMDNSTGVIDTGGIFTFVSGQVMSNYLEVTKNVKGRKSIVHWDSKIEKRYIFPQDFDKLVEITLEFEGGTVALPPSAQVIPSSIIRRLDPCVKGDCLYLSIQQAGFVPTDKIYLGFPWISRYYLIFDTYKKKVGIAEIKGRSDYIWEDLRHS